MLPLSSRRTDVSIQLLMFLSPRDLGSESSLTALTQNK